MSAEGRRIASIVLPNLPCELVRRRAAVDGPLGVIIDGEDSPGEGRSSGQASAVLDAVDDLARRLGVRSGLKVTEAAALTSQLSIHHVAEVEIVRALGAVAEVALTLGSVASIAHPEELDTVWLDITGAAHLVGGELALKHELQSRVEELGHRCRVAIADGPRLARALALWGQDWDPSSLIALPGRGAEAIAPLPVKALPIHDDALSLLLRLGVLTVGDLARLPRAGSSARLQSPSGGAKSQRSKRDGTKSHASKNGSKNPVAAEVLALVQGYDPMPLRPYRPPEILEEHTSFEEGVDKIETLLFVLRGMTSHLSTRLTARGISVARIHLSITYDRSIFRLRYPERADDPDAEIERWEIELPMPLSRSKDLFRAVRAKLEARSSSDSLAAPALGLSVELSQIAPQRRSQLDLSRDVAIDPDALVSLLAELSAEIGTERLGTLSIDDVHRPEHRSLLISPLAEVKRSSAASSSSACSLGGIFDGFAEPTRLLPEPLPLGCIDPRALSSSERPLAVGHHMYQIGSVAFSIRLSGVEWWTPTPVSRDYARVSLSCRGEHPTTGLAWIYWDRTRGEAFLHGWWE